MMITVINVSVCLLATEFYRLALVTEEEEDTTVQHLLTQLHLGSHIVIAFFKLSPVGASKCMAFFFFIAMETCLPRRGYKKIRTTDDQRLLSTMKISYFRERYSDMIVPTRIEFITPYSNDRERRQHVKQTAYLS